MVLIIMYYNTIYNTSTFYILYSFFQFYCSGDDDNNTLLENSNFPLKTTKCRGEEMQS